MSSIAVVPGSFDPVTKGHLDVILRAAELFDEVHVVVVHNPAKQTLLTAAEREQLLRQALAQQEVRARVQVAAWQDGLLVDYCKQVGARVLVKGIRSQVDVAYETPMVLMNRSLAAVETIFLLPNPAYSLVSSSLVRQVHALGGDVSEFVPPPVADFLRALQPTN